MMMIFAALWLLGLGQDELLPKDTDLVLHVRDAEALRTRLGLENFQPAVHGPVVVGVRKLFDRILGGSEDPQIVLIVDQTLEKEFRDKGFRLTRSDRYLIVTLSEFTADGSVRDNDGYRTARLVLGGAADAILWLNLSQVARAVEEALKAQGVKTAQWPWTLGLGSAVTFADDRITTKMYFQLPEGNMAIRALLSNEKPQVPDFVPRDAAVVNMQYFNLAMLRMTLRMVKKDLPFDPDKVFDQVRDTLLKVLNVDVNTFDKVVATFVLGSGFPRGAIAFKRKDPKTNPSLRFGPLQVATVGDYVLIGSARAIRSATGGFSQTGVFKELSELLPARCLGVTYLPAPDFLSERVAGAVSFTTLEKKGIGNTVIVRLK